MADNQINKIQKRYDALEIIEAVIRFSGLNAAQFLKKIGANQTLVQDIRNGKTKTVSRKLAEKITGAYPEISERYLILGEGPMLTGDIVTGDRSQTVIGTNNHHNTNNSVDERLLKMLEENQQIIRDNQQERLKLLTIIENLTSK